MGAVRQASPHAVKAMLRDGGELALVDVREQGVYFNAHLLFACCIPLSHLELRAGALIPRRTTRIVLCDEEDGGSARQAAAKLGEYGYSDVSVMTGGVNAWRDAGFEVFSGVNVVSKAFGEYVEHRYATPHITAGQLAAKQADGDNLIVLDSRPADEFHNISIPGGINCPGAELVYRVFDAVQDPDTLVVVNCAGRTRSIIGAQSLVNAGIPNRVVALKDGTMGWQLAGLTPARGATGHAASPTPQGLARAIDAAVAVGARYGVEGIDHERLVHWQQEDRSRTLYLFDVRTFDEFAAGHIAGSRHAPGGQLVQATDEYVATRHARIVLIDADGVRATMTASWLRQMGWNEVFVLRLDQAPQLVTGAQAPGWLGFKRAPTLPAAELKQRLERDAATVVDFANSLQYRREHVPGAFWAVRSRLSDSLGALPADQPLVFTSPDGTLAHYAAADLAQAASPRQAVVLDGGTRGWIAAGYAMAAGADRLTSEPNDIWYKPYEQDDAVHEAMQGYLDWEVNLVHQIERDGDAHFR